MICEKFKKVLALRTKIEHKGLNINLIGKNTWKKIKHLKQL